MMAILKNILLAAVWIGQAVFIHYCVNKLFDVIEYCLNDQEVYHGKKNGLERKGNKDTAEEV